MFINLSARCILFNTCLVPILVDFIIISVATKAVYIIIVC